MLFDSLNEHMIVTTEVMAATFKVDLAGGAARYRYRVPCTKPIATSALPLPIDPYLLGAWLGDGNSMSAQITCDLRDDVFSQLQAAGCNPEVRSTDSRRRHVAAIAFAPLDGMTLHSRLRGLGLIGNKHIPPVYLRASEDQRRALLQGILDTDGTAGCSVALGLTCRPLADGAVELARSLGFKPTIRTRPSKLNGKRCKDGRPHHYLQGLCRGPALQAEAKIGAATERG